MTDYSNPGQQPGAQGGEPTTQEKLDTANRMIDVVEQFSGDLQALAKKYRRAKLLQRFLGISLAVDLCLTAAFGYLEIRTQSNTDSIHKDSVSSCQSSNGTRASAKQINDAIGELFRDYVPSAPSAKIDAFEQKVAATYAARNCEQIYAIRAAADK